MYQEFALLVNGFLKELLETSSIEKYVLAPHRGKDLGSLELKINTKTEEGNPIKKLIDIEDLAGCRVSFCVGSDIERFKKYIYEEFDVVSETLHHTSEGDERGYNATHVIVKLKSKRENLLEYKKFKNLKCEIQLKTVLFHAWSEVEHSIGYKPSDIPETFKKEVDTLRKRLASVANKTIKQAQYELDYVSASFEKLKQGIRLFDASFFENIKDIKTNNELHQQFKYLLSYIEEYGDKVPAEIDIIDIIKKALRKSKSLKKEKTETFLGDLPGRDYSNIGDICLDILNRLKFNYPEGVLGLLKNLSRDEVTKVGEKAINIFSKFAKYTYSRKEKAIYFSPQLFVLKKMEEWSDKDLLSHLPLLSKVSEQLLSPSFESTFSEDGKTMTVQQGVLPGNDTVKRIRERTVSLLIKTYNISKKVSEKRQVLHILEMATHEPYEGEYTEELRKIILKNTNFLISFYSSAIKKKNNEIIKAIEEHIYRLVRCFPRGLRGVKRLQEELDKNREYKIYKTLVGHDHLFSKELGRQKAGKERTVKIDEYISKINQTNFAVWKKRILLIARSYSQVDDGGQFNYFCSFLRKLGEKRPKIAIQLVLKNEKELEVFLASLVSGIWESRKREEAKKILEKWISGAKYLSICARVFEHINEIDIKLLEAIYKKAKAKKETRALISVVISIVSQYERSNIGKDLFVGCVKELAQSGYDQWVDHIWYRAEPILQSLTKDDWKTVLGSLVDVPNIGFETERVLTIPAQKYPKETIDFFSNRIEKQEEEGFAGKYRALPFDFQHLKDALSGNAEVVIDEALKGVNSENSSLSWESSRLIQIIFPSFHSKLEKRLVGLVKKGEKEEAKRVLQVLRSYKGEVFLHGVCKEVIKKYPNNEKYEKEMFSILSEMGVVSGEYGFADGYKKKKQEIQDWKKGKDIAIQAFVKKYEEYLSEQIILHKKRADEEIAIREREFGG